MKRALLSLSLLLALAACESGPDKSPPPRPTAPASVPASASASAPGSAPASASAPTPVAAPGAESAFAGAWEGAFDAKKGTVELPPKVKDKGLAADDGKALIGAGTIELAIGKNGEVRGRGKGALGPLTINGTVDGEMIRAQVMAEDPHSTNAVSGTLVGPLKDGVIKARLRVSVAKAEVVIVREADLELKKKP